MSLPRRLRFTPAACASIVLAASLAVAQAAEKVTSGIGIEILKEGRALSARSGQTLSPDDRLRVLVSPQTDQYVYVVHSDGVTAALIYDSKLRIAEKLVSVPGNNERFKFDGKSRTERLTVIATPHRLPALKAFANGPIPDRNWRTTEARLKADSRLPLTYRTSEKPLMMAGGGVRNIDAPRIPPAAHPTVRRYSGLGMVVKNYEFRVRSH